MNTTSVTNKTNLGWLHSPVLDQFPGCDWELNAVSVTRRSGDNPSSIDEVRAEWAEHAPAFTWVKDAELRWLSIGSMTHEQLVEALHMALKPAKGYERVAKRWSRIVRPVGFATYAQPSWVLNDDDPRLTDGMIFMSRSFAETLTEFLPVDVKHAHALKGMLKHVYHGEFTWQLAGYGQLKGVAWIKDDMPEGVDLILPRSADDPSKPDWKTELDMSLGPNGSCLTFVPLHNEVKRASLDLQTISNVMCPLGPITPKMLIAWAAQAADETIEGLRSGKTQAELADISRFDLDDYLNFEQRRADGVSPMWPLRRVLLGSNAQLMFPRMTRQLGDSFLAFLKKGNRFRVPLRGGGRFYIHPDARVEKGHVMLSEEEGMLVNPIDQLTLDPKIKTIEQFDSARRKLPAGILDIAGGADLDDGFLCIAVKDAKNHKPFVLCIRQPNGYRELSEKPSKFEAATEVTVLKLQGEIPAEWGWTLPEVDLTSFDRTKIKVGKPAKIDSAQVHFDAVSNQLTKLTEYTNEGVLHAAELIPLGLLGMTANLCMLSGLSTRTVLPEMPLGISDITDLTHGKWDISREDKSALFEWVKAVNQAIVENFRIPELVADRVPEDLLNQLEIEDDPADPAVQLFNGIKEVASVFSIALDDLCLEQEPPLLPYGQYYLAEAAKLLSINANFWGQLQELREAIGEDFAPTEDDMLPLKEQLLAELGKYNEDEQPFILMSLAHIIYHGRGVVQQDDRKKWSDSVLWMPGIRRNEAGKAFSWVSGDNPDNAYREPGMADRFVDAMIKLGVIGDIKLELTHENEHGRLVSAHAVVVKQEPLSVPQRMSISLNAVRYTLAPLAKSVLVQGGMKEDEISDDQTWAAIQAIVSECRKEFHATGNNMLFTNSEVTFQVFNFSGKPMIGAFTASDQGWARMGTLPNNNGYADYVMVDQAYHISDFYIQGLQLVLVVDC